MNLYDQFWKFNKIVKSNNSIVQDTEAERFKKTIPVMRTHSGIYFCFLYYKIFCTVRPESNKRRLGNSYALLILQ